MPQITDTIMMVRPANFGYNSETAANNSFQSEEGKDAIDVIRSSAIQEFNNMVRILNEKGIDTIVIEDSPEPIKTDAVFPNNWISFHRDGVIVTYPMWAESRRHERSEDIVRQMSKFLDSDRRYSFEHFEESNMFLEGTGSMILDRENKIVYACLSPRTDIRMLDKFCVLMAYTPIVFYAKDRNGEDIYHTNVMMALGEDFAVVCLDSITNPNELLKLKTSLEETGKHIIKISSEQVESFAGNMLQVTSKEGETYLVMSQTAFTSLSKDQIEAIEQFTKILPIPIPIIEKFGGGSVRCMMAEVFV